MQENIEYKIVKAVDNKYQLYVNNSFVCDYDDILDVFKYLDANYSSN